MIVSPSLEERVVVLPFTRQPQGDDIVIGSLETGQYLAMPADAVEILDDLAKGATLREAQTQYSARYGEIPDIEDFIATLEVRGFVQRSQSTSAKATGTFGQERWGSFTFLSQSKAQCVFSKFFLTTVAVIVVLGLSAVVFNPSILPGPSAMYFPSHQIPALLLLVLWNVFAVLLHELGHVTAARAIGVPARLGIGNRLWVLVGETDLTGLWSVPRRKRYIPLLAGPLVDLLSVSILLFAFHAQNSHWITLPAPVLRFAQAVAFGYLMRLLWQCFLFVETDFYYLLATFSGSTNLLRNTEIFLRNQLARAVKWVRPVPEEFLPRSEVRAVHLYWPVYLIGRVLAFWSLFFVTVPVVWSYVRSSIVTLRAGYGTDPAAFLGGFLLACIAVVPLFVGSFLWIRSLLLRATR